MSKIKKILKNKKILILLIIASVILILLGLTGVVLIPRIVEQNKNLTEEFFSYKLLEKIKKGQFAILVKIQDDAGIEYIILPDGTKVTAYNKKKVSLDYEIIADTNYEFKIKVNGKEEVTENLYKEHERIKGNYTQVNGMYVNAPDLTGFEAKYTRYLVPNASGYLTPGDVISKAPSSDWYDYKSQKWANIVTENGGQSVYMVWIPRYCFKLDQVNQRSDVKFIDVYNNYTDESGNVTVWADLEADGYQIPEAFEYYYVDIPGYWATKYTLGDNISPSIINFNLAVTRGVMKISGVSLNATYTNANPITSYTISLNGDIVENITDSSIVSAISSQTFTLGNMVDGENVVNLTGLNANGEIVGTMTKIYKPAVVNVPDLTGFNKNTTFYVTYDENNIEHSTIPITEPAPVDWYEYGESRWANIVTRNNDTETYYVWIPRYEFRLDQTNQRSEINFIEGTKTETSEGYQIPDAFTFNGVEISGYWATKYTLGDAFSPRFNTEIAATNTSIRTKGIIGTAVGAGQTYKYYIDGVYKGESTSSAEEFVFDSLTPDTQYTILVEIRNSTTDAYIGSVVKQANTIDANAPVLEGFNESVTYYLLYDDAGNEVLGDLIKNDGSNMPDGWYDYSQRKWANIVVKNGTQKVYMVWIPRYEFKITDAQQSSPATGRIEVRFIKGVSTDTDVKYQIPEAFTFNGVEIPGYWATKYTLGD